MSLDTLAIFPKELMPVFMVHPKRDSTVSNEDLELEKEKKAQGSEKSYGPLINKTLQRV